LRIVSSDSPGTATNMTASVTTSTTKAGGPDVYGVATVTVVDNLGAPVANAMVEGSFTGDFWFVSRGPTATDAAGQVTFTTEPSFLKKPSFGFQITAVTHSSLTWQP
jgi:protocatechuate 3,4-dioxygenase beta subunit